MRKYLTSTVLALTVTQSICPCHSAATICCLVPQFLQVTAIPLLTRFAQYRHNPLCYVLMFL